MTCSSPQEKTSDIRGVSSPGKETSETRGVSNPQAETSNTRGVPALGQKLAIPKVFQPLGRN